MTALLLAPVMGSAAERAGACRVAFTRAEKAEHEGHLSEARGLFARCARKTCGRELYDECGRRWVTLGAEGAGARTAVAASEGSGLGCRDALVAAEKAEMESRLLDARALFVGCASSACGRPLARKCGKSAARIGREIPTLVFRATDETGKAVTDVKVTIDGRPVIARLTPTPVPADPGSHEVAFKAADGAAAADKVVLARREHRRLLAVTLRPVSAEPPATASPSLSESKSAPAEAVAPAAPPASEAAVAAEEPPRHGASVEPRAHGPGPYLLGALGVAGLGGYVLFTRWGRVDNDNLSQCSPRCPVPTVHHIRQLYLGADISAAVGVAALVGSVTWLVARSGSNERERASNGPRYVVDVQPTPSGALASLKGAF